jgi:hypothetical protein
MKDFFSMYSFYDYSQEESSIKDIKKYLSENENIIKEIIYINNEKMHEEEENENRDKLKDINNNEDLKEEKELLAEIPEELRESVNQQLKIDKNKERPENKEDKKEKEIKEDKINEG